MSKTTTVNISLPQSMYSDVKDTAEERGYASVSELVRDALRRILYPRLTVNGFTEEFEDAVPESAAEPVEESKQIKDIGAYLDQMQKEVEGGRQE